LKTPATKARQASPPSKIPMMRPILVDLLTSTLGASRGGGFAVRLLSSARSAGAVGCEGMAGRATPRAVRAKRVMMKVSFILESPVCLNLVFETDLLVCKKLKVYFLVSHQEGHIYKTKVNFHEFLCILHSHSHTRLCTFTAHFKNRSDSKEKS
jgi:hypothetical protein